MNVSTDAEVDRYRACESSDISVDTGNLSSLWLILHTAACSISAGDNLQKDNKATFDSSVKIIVKESKN